KDRLAAAKWAPLTDDSRSGEFGAAISPDGKFAAYIRDLDGKLDAWVSPTGTGATPVNVSNGSYLVGSRNARSVGFTRNSAEVCFSDNRPSPDNLKALLVPIEGGAPREFGDGMSLVWSPVDGRLAYHTNDKGDPIFVAKGDGSDPV